MLEITNRGRRGFVFRPFKLRDVSQCRKVIYLLGMRNLTAIALTLAATLSIAGQTTGTSEPSTLITSGDIDTFLKALPAGKVSDNPIRVVDVGGYHVGVYGVYRPKSIKQEANIHMTKVTEVYYILDGSATLVTGGTIPDAKPMSPNSTTLQITAHRGRSFAPCREG